MQKWQIEKTVGRIQGAQHKVSDGRSKRKRLQRANVFAD